jgi:hypothetical protein
MFEYFSFALPIAWTKPSKFLSAENVNQNVLVLIFYEKRFKVPLQPTATEVSAKIIATAPHSLKIQAILDYSSLQPVITSVKTKDMSATTP